MGNIPLPVELPKAPGAPMQSMVPTKTISVDTSGLANAAVRAGTQPLMPAGMFAQGEAGEAWGKTLRVLGAEFGDFAERFARAEDAKALTQLQVNFETGLSEFTNSLASNRDPSTWVDKYDEFASKAKRDIFDKQPLSRRARAEAEINWLKQVSGNRINIAGSAVSEATRQTRHAFTLKDRQLASDGNFNGRRQNVDTAESTGALPTYEADAMRNDIDAQERQTQRSIDLASRPGKVREWLRDPEKADVPEYFKGLNPAQVREIDENAQASLFDRQRLFLEDVKTSVANGLIRDSKDLREFAKGLPQEFRAPWVWQGAMGILEGSVLDVTEFNRQRERIKSFDPQAPGAVVIAAQLAAANAAFPKEYSAALNRELEAVGSGSGKRSVALKYISDTVQALHDEEKLTDDNGQPLAYKEEAPLVAALGDPAKVKAFGLTEKDAEVMRGIGGPARIEWFRQRVSLLQRAAAESGKPMPINAEAYGKLSEFTKKLFDRALNEGKFEDFDIKQKSARRAAKLLEEAERVNPPDVEAAEAWLKKQLSGSARTQGAGEVAPDAAPTTPPEPAGAPQDFNGTTNPSILLPPIPDDWDKDARQKLRIYKPQN